MAVQSRTTLKNWFLKGLKPLQNQFADWIDSYWHKSDTINISDISGLQTQLDSLAGGGGGGGGSAVSATKNNGDSITVSTSEILELIIVRSSTTQVVKCGTTAGSGNVFNVEVANGQGYIHREDFAPEGSSVLLHFTSSGAFTLITKKVTIT